MSTRTAMCAGIQCPGPNDCMLGAQRYEVSLSDHCIARGEPPRSDPN